MDADLTDFGTHPSTWVSSPATLEAMGASKSAPAGNQTRAQRWQRWILPLNHWHSRSWCSPSPKNNLHVLTTH